MPQWRYLVFGLVVTGCLLCRMNVDQEVEIPVTTVETVITTTAEDVPIIETTLEEVQIYLSVLY